MQSRSVPATDKYVSTRQPSPLGMSILRVSAGDAALAKIYRDVAWQTYLEAGFPHGYSEDGLERWWAERLSFNAN